MRVVRYIFVTLLSLVLIVIAIIAITINFVFTPTKLSPTIEKVVNQNLNAKLSLSSVELTFFSSFPNFLIVINDGALMTLQNDTIVSFEKIDVAVNPIALIRDSSVVISKVEFFHPVINALVSEDGAMNWDVVKGGGDEIETDSVVTVKKSLNISLSNIRIIDGNIILNDRQKNVYGELKEVNMSVDGNLSKKISDVRFAMSFTDGLFWQNDRVVLKKINFSTNANVELNAETKNINIKGASIELNTVKFEVAGAINPDSVDVKLSLKIPTLESLLGVVSIVDKSAKVSTTGSVVMDVTVKGGYKGDNIPVADVVMSIDNGSLRYDGYKNGIDKLDINARAHIDFGGNSTITVDDFSLRGTSTSINFRGNVDNLFNNPTLTYSTNSTVNFHELASTLPLENGVEIAGKVKINSKGTVSERQLKDGDYAHINADGEMQFTGVVFNIPDRIESKFDELDVVLSNTKEGLLRVKATMNGVSVRDSANHISMDSLLIVAAGQHEKDKSFVGGKFDYSNLKVSLKSDTLALVSGHSTVMFRMNKRVNLRFHTDSLHLRAMDNMFDMTSANVNVTLGEKLLKGEVGFNRINISIPKFPLPMSMPATILSVDNQTIVLKEAVFKIGDSDVVMSGMIDNLISAASAEKPLTMRVDITSSMLNLTQIAHTFNQLESIDTIAEVADSSELKLFKIPQNIDFELNTNFERVEFGALKMENVNGEVTLKNGVARIENLSLGMLGAKLSTTVVYDSNTGDDSAAAGLIVSSKAIDVHSVIKLVPSLDTLMPMLNSFEGKLNFRLIANTKFYQGFTIHPNELQATIGLQGEDLVLLDGKTFSEISKLLMFKNKKRNVVDSVGVQMAINNGAVEVFPFLIQIDRYRAAIGGEHSLTNNFNYHISILKSPIPFKFGVNISGSLDDIKVGIGKTKYKSLNTPSSVKQLNPKYVSLGKEIEARIRKL